MNKFLRRNFFAYIFCCITAAESLAFGDREGPSKSRVVQKRSAESSSAEDFELHYVAGHFDDSSHSHSHAADDVSSSAAAIQSTNPLAAVRSSSLFDANAGTCVGRCAFAFVDGMTTQLGDERSAGLLNLNYNEFLVAFSNASFFEHFCKLYHDFTHCYTRCPYGYMQELLTRSAEIVDHYCVYNYRAITEKFGCLANIDRKTSKQCLRVCTRHHDAVSSLMQNFKTLALNGDPSDAERYLAESCEYVICTLHCDVPTIAATCDFGTAELVVNLTKKSFESMRKLALDTGAIEKWPALCSDIRTYTMPRLRARHHHFNVTDGNKLSHRRNESNGTNSLADAAGSNGALKNEALWVFWTIFGASFAKFIVKKI